MTNGNDYVEGEVHHASHYLSRETGDVQLMEAQRNEPLTKLEYFSGLIMQGFIASIGQHDVTKFELLASDAVRGAQALIAQLNSGK